MSENINHPDHYNALPAVCDKCGSKIECIQVVRHLNFNIGNIIKYLWRAGYKDKDKLLEDLKKARWYLDDEIERIEGDKVKKATRNTFSIERESKHEG